MSLYYVHILCQTTKTKSYTQMLFTLVVLKIGKKLKNFSIRVFFHRHWPFTGQQGKERNHLLFYSTTSTRSWALRHLFATLHVRWLSRKACIYQTATRWDLPPYRITTWMIDDLMLIFVCVLDDLILGFWYRNLTWESDKIELTSETPLVLKANRLAKCGSHPDNWDNSDQKMTCLHFRFINILPFWYFWYGETWQLIKYNGT